MAFSFYEQHIHEDPDFPIIFHNDNLMEDSNFLSHWHENIEFLYFRQGRGVVLCDAVPYTALPGDAVIINTGALHTIRSQTPVSNYDCLIVDKLFLEGFDLPFEKMRLLSPLRDEVIGAHFDRIAGRHQRKSRISKPPSKAETLSLFHTYISDSLAAGSSGGSTKTAGNLTWCGRRSRISGSISPRILRLTIYAVIWGSANTILPGSSGGLPGRTVTDTINLLRCSHAQEPDFLGALQRQQSADGAAPRSVTTFRHHGGIADFALDTKLCYDLKRIKQ